MKSEKIKDFIIKKDRDRILVIFDKRMYEKEAIFAAAYKFTDVCTIIIEPVDDKSVGAYFKIKQEIDQSLNEIVEKFCNEALDQQVRLDLEKRYGNIRELVYQHAFSPLKSIKEKININDK